MPLRRPCDRSRRISPRSSGRFSSSKAGSAGYPSSSNNTSSSAAASFSFARDPDFHDSLDVLVLVDLSAAPVRVLQRYMGREAACAFFEYHRPTDIRRDDTWPPA